MMVNYLQIFLKSQNTVFPCTICEEGREICADKNERGNQGKEYMRPGEELIQCRKDAKGSL